MALGAYYVHLKTLMREDFSIVIEFSRVPIELFLSDERLMTHFEMPTPRNCSYSGSHQNFQVCADKELTNTPIQRNRRIPLLLISGHIPPLPAFGSLLHEILNTGSV